MNEKNYYCCDKARTDAISQADKQRAHDYKMANPKQYLMESCLTAATIIICLAIVVIGLHGCIPETSHY